MSNVLDAGNQPISYIGLHQEEGTDSQIILIRVSCTDGQFLLANDNPNARILVRETGIGSYVDIATSPFDLSPYDGTIQDFDMKVHTNAVTGILSTAVEVRVTFNP